MYHTRRRVEEVEERLVYPNPVRFQSGKNGSQSEARLNWRLDHVEEQRRDDRTHRIDCHSITDGENETKGGRE